MTLRKKILFTVFSMAVFVVGAGLWLIRRPTCPGAYWLNFDATCRVADSRSDGTSLIEYFDPDTNELRLYLRASRRDLQIEHPYGKVKNFKDAITENQLKFNPHEGQSLLVNGEVFPITPK